MLHVILSFGTKLAQDPLVVAVSARILNLRRRLSAIIDVILRYSFCVSEREGVVFKSVNNKGRERERRGERLVNGQTT